MVGTTRTVSSDVAPDFDEYAPALRAAIRALREQATAMRRQGSIRHVQRAEELEIFSNRLVKLARWLGDVTPQQGIRLDDPPRVKS